MAGLQEQSVPVPLLPLNEKAPSKAGPFGRLTKAVNYVVNKFSGNGTNFQLDKRNGFHSLPTALYNPYGGDAPVGSLPAATVQGKLGDVNFIIGADGKPYVYSPANTKWAKFDKETIIANRISTADVKLDSSAIKNNDSASIGSVHCHAWTDQGTGDGYAEFVNDDGTPVRTQFVAAAKTGTLATGVRIKVVADQEENVFWIVSDGAGTPVYATAFSASTGAVIGTPVLALNLFAAGCFWDIVHDHSVTAGVCVVTPGSAGTTTAGITIASVAIVSSVPVLATSDSSNLFSADVTNGVAFARAANNGFLYVVTVDVPGHPTPGSFDVCVYKTDVTCDVLRKYQPIQGSMLNSSAISSVGGYVDNVNSRVYAFAGMMPYTGSAPVAYSMIDSYTMFGYATDSLDFQGPAVRRSLLPASRAMLIGEIPCLFTFYTSVPTIVSEVDGSVQQGAPTFFVIRADTGDVIGRLFPGQAAGNSIWQSWSGTAPSPDGFQLPSPRDASDGGTIVALPLTGSQSVTRVRQNDGPFVDTFTTSIGIKDVIFGIDYGNCVECENETLIPGALPRSFDGKSFATAGIEITPEQPIITDDATAGPWNPGEKRSYVIVYERMNRSGNKSYSPSSIALQYEESAGPNHSASLRLPTLRATTHDDAIISVYRNVYQSGQEGLTHHKITSDQSPIYNDPNVDFITFVDSVDDASALLGATLYGGSGAVPASLGGGDGQDVDHDCAPAFNDGTVLSDRAFLSAYDGAVWFSLPGQSGVSMPFSQLFKMTVPSRDPVTALDAIDQHLVIFCGRSIWTPNQSNYLDAAGQGDIPTPYQLKISNGGSGFRFSFKDGIVYSSSAGSFYLLTRDLDSEYIGAAIEDDAKGHNVIGSASDDSQRVYFQLDDSNASICVFDIVSKTWALWQVTSTFGQLLTNVGGKVAICSTSGAVKVLTPDSYDDDGSAITSTARFADISTAGLPGCQLIWKVFFIGVSYSDHQLFVDFIPDGRTADVELFGPIDPLDFGVGAGDEYRSVVEPEQMETSSFGIEIHDFLAVPGRGLSLQQLGLSVGIMPGTRSNGIGRIGSPQ